MAFFGTNSLICGCAVLLAGSAVGGAEQTLAAGVPLRVVLENRVLIQHAGQPVRGRLLEPMFVYDHVVIPADSVVEGNVAEIGGVAAGRRFQALLSGNLTPARDASVQWNTLVLSDGSRLALKTAPARGTAHVVAIGKPRQKTAGAVAEPVGVRGALKPPGSLRRLGAAAWERFPYHRQAWAARTVFTGVLEDSVTLPLPRPPEPATFATSDLTGQTVRARLLTPIDSKSSRRGTPVEAAVTQPLFSADGRLLVPEGSRLSGEVIQAEPARALHRNGRLLFVFREIRFPSGAARNVQGYLEEMDADFSKHLAIDSEGAARAENPKSRFLFPAIALAGAGLSLHQDYNSAGVPDQDIGGRAESGAIGLGLIGTAVAQASHALASGMAFTGAAYSVYSNFLTRGQDVVLPVNTRVEVSLRTDAR